MAFNIPVVGLVKRKFLDFDKCRIGGSALSHYAISRPPTVMYVRVSALLP